MNNISNESISEVTGLKLIGPSDLNILSVGISTGGSAEIKMIAGHPQRTVIATTIDLEGIQKTSQLIQSKGLAERIIVKNEDITKPLTYVSEHFDFIYARLVLHYLNNIQLKSALGELYRVLKTNGTIFIVVRSGDDWEGTLPGTKYFPDTGMTCYPVHKTLGTNKIEYVYRHFHTEQSITIALEQAGFHIQSIKTYFEQLYSDYDRQEKAVKLSKVIEVVAKKVN